MFADAAAAVHSIIERLSNEIQSSALEKDFGTISSLTKSASAVSALASVLEEEGARFRVIEPEFRSAKRNFQVEITDGALRNSYLSVTEAINAGILSSGQRIQVKTGAGEFETVVMEANRLQARSEIKNFFAEREIKPGDYVELTEVSTGSWVMEKVDTLKDDKAMRLTGERLNDLYKLGAAQARYRENGVWYHPLEKFPGVLLDANGYALFKTAADYANCSSVKKGPDPNTIHVKGGIASLPFYVPLNPPPTSQI